MIMVDFKTQLLELLVKAYLEDITFLKTNLKDESVFSYTLFCDSGFSIFASAAETRKMLNEQITILSPQFANKEQAALYAETHTSEWNYFSSPKLESFVKIDELIKKIKDADYNGELTGVYKEGDFDGSNYEEFYNFFVNLVIELCLKLKNQNIFNTSPFEQDILLGLQIADPDEDEEKWVLTVSEQVNSPQWHKKMLEAYQQ